MSKGSKRKSWRYHDRLWNWIARDMEREAKLRREAAIVRCGCPVNAPEADPEKWPCPCGAHCTDPECVALQKGGAT